MEYHLARSLARSFARSLVRSGTAGEKKKSRGQIRFRRFLAMIEQHPAASAARVSRSAQATRNHRERKKDGETLVSRNLRRRRLRSFASRL